jgi:hypothetical protein
MVPILKEILMKEIGEANLSPLNWKQVSPVQYKFLVDINDFTEVVTVDFEEFEEGNDELKAIYLPPRYRNAKTFYNIAYEISGVETQFAKSDMKTLLTILSTVVDIIKNFINKNQPDALYISATEKIGGEQNIKQKSNLYQAFLKRGIKQVPGYAIDTYRGGNIIIKV